MTLMDSLGKTGELESVGGVGYLSQLADGLPRITNVAHYAGIVKQKAQLRALIYECDSDYRGSAKQRRADGDCRESRRKDSRTRLIRFGRSESCRMG